MLELKCSLLQILRFNQMCLYRKDNPKSMYPLVVLSVGVHRSQRNNLPTQKTEGTLNYLQCFNIWFVLRRRQVVNVSYEVDFVAHFWAISFCFSTSSTQRPWSTLAAGWTASVSLHQKPFKKKVTNVNSHSHQKKQDVSNLIGLS